MSKPFGQEVEVLLSASQIAGRVQELGAQIAADHPEGKLCMVGVLKGSFVFFADLVRAIPRELHCEFIGISSYGNDTESSGVVQITSDLTSPIEGSHVVLVEDIVDTGLSMRYLLDNFATRHPASLSICTLLEKPDNAKVAVPIRYSGFKIPNSFVVGYGLDVAGLYRNLPYIGVYRGS